MRIPTPEEREAANRFAALVDMHRAWNAAEDVQQNVFDELGSTDETVEFWSKCHAQLAILIDAGEI